jgi:hypothetical protein
MSAGGTESLDLQAQVRFLRAAATPQVNEN